MTTLIHEKLNASQNRELEVLFRDGFDSCFSKSILKTDFKNFCAKHSIVFSLAEFEDAFAFFENICSNDYAE